MENSASTNWQICKLEKTSNKKDFDCGIEELNEYIKKYARQSQDRGLATTFTIISQIDKKVIGYYSLNLSKIKKEDLSLENQKGLPNCEIGVVLLGKLARTLSEKGNGLGEKLIIDAMHRVYKISEEVGTYGFIVDAINEKAKIFYTKYGFIEFPHQPMRLMLNKETLKSKLIEHKVIEGEKVVKQPIQNTHLHKNL